MATIRGRSAASAAHALRWLAGVTLSGLCGLALIGSALYLDLDRQSSFAARPDSPPRRSPSEAGERVNAGKGDRLVRPIDIVAAKQTYQVADDDQDRRQGDRARRALHAAVDDADH